MENERTLTVDDLKKIIVRRRWALIIPTLVFLAVAVAVALILSPIYQATSTILLEEQEISKDYVISTATVNPEQRLQNINQRVINSARLIEVIRRFDLYPDKRNRMTMDEIVEEMRKKDIKFQPITAEIIDKRTRNPLTATVAFTVSYQGKDPAKVLQVANVLASLYLEENLKMTGQQIEGATKFLEEEMRSVQNNLVALEAQIAAYKQTHTLTLPELFQLNTQTMDRLDLEIERARDQLRTLKEKETGLQSQIASIPQDIVNQDKERLRELRVKLGALQTRYSDAYPDVIKTRAEIADLEKRLAQTAGKGDVSRKPDNPVYVTLVSQLSGTQSDIDSMKRQLVDLEKRRNDYVRRLENSPRVEEGYKNLTVQRNNTQAKYDDLMKRYMEAKLTRGLEKEKLGDRFTLIDPARLPEKPVKPQRLLIVIMGLVLGIGAGAGAAALQETSDHSARRPDDLGRFLLPVLAEIPDIVTQEDIFRKKRRRRLIALILSIGIIVIVLCVHLFVIDLDVLWARIARRLDL